MRNSQAVFIVAAALALSSPGLRADEGNSKSAQEPVLLSRLLNARVESRAGEDLGKIEELILSPQSGKMQFALLGRGGAGQDGEYIAVPWTALDVKADQRVTLKVDKQKLMTAPPLDKTLMSINDPGYVVTIYRFFEVPVDVGGSDAEVGGSGFGQGGSTSAATVGGERDDIHQQQPGEGKPAGVDKPARDAEK